MGNNIYNVLKLEYQKISNVEEIDFDGNIANVSFNFGFDFEEIDFIKGSATFSSSMNRGDKGLVYPKSLNFKIADRDVNGNVFIDVPVIVKVTLSNGKKILLGDLDKPVLFLFSHNFNIVSVTSDILSSSEFIFLS